jgi:transposase
VGLQRKSGQDRHAYAGGDEGLHDDHVVAGGSEVLARAVVPALLAQPGVGPVAGAHVLISWSHPGRLGSEAAFAMLAGAAPIEASSGRVVCHRLNRGGDRQLKRALHTIVTLRERCHEPTRR